MTRYPFYWLGIFSPFCIALTSAIQPFNFWAVSVTIMAHVVASILFDTREKSYQATASQAAEVIAKAKADVASERGALFPYYVLVIDEEDAAEAWPNGVPEVFEGARVSISKRGTFGVAYGYRIKKEQQ